MAATDYTMRLALRAWVEPLLWCAGNCALIAVRCGIPIGLASAAYAHVGRFVARHGLTVTGK